MLVNVPDSLYKELETIIKLHAHAKSALKIGNHAEAIAFRDKADLMAKKWFAKLQLPTIKRG